MRSLLQRRRRAQGLAEVAVVCAIMTSLSGGGAGAAWQVLAGARRTAVISNLRQIHSAIVMSADDNDGRLPSAAFYPDIRRDPNAARTSPTSIRRQINGLPDALWVNPAAPESYRSAGLTFVWNSAVNGRALDQLDPRTWLLMDMNAAAYLLPDISPRPEGYLVLYADGQVKLEHQPPLVVQPAQAQQLAQQVAQATGRAVQAAAPAGGGAGAAAGGGGAAAADPGPAPEDPQAERRRQEEEARQANPDEDDRIDE